MQQAIFNTYTPLCLVINVLPPDVCVEEVIKVPVAACDINVRVDVVIGRWSDM